jgi:phosphatidylinositol alpha-1,6-mannosyltransferase
VPRTLVITNDFPPRIGGIESFVESVCALLERDVVVYTSGPAGAAAGDADRGYPVVRDGSTLLPTPRVAARAAELMASFGARRVVFGAAAPLGLLAPGLRRAGAERIIGLTHGHEVWWATLPGSRPLLRRIADGCDHLTTVSAYTEQRIAPALSPTARSRLIRLPPPVDPAFRPMAGPMAGRAAGDRRRCIAVARFVAQKGLPTLLAAWRRVLDEWTRTERPELVLVGAGPQSRRLHDLVARLRLGQTVRFTGPLDRDRLVSQLQQADVFALPMRTRLGGLNAEGFGLAAIEAAACGLPVVVGRSGGAPETVRHGRTGFLVDPEDPVDVASRIGALLADGELAQTMGQRGRAFVTRDYGPDQARQTLMRALGP